MFLHDITEQGEVVIYIGESVKIINSFYLYTKSYNFPVTTQQMFNAGCLDLKI